MSESAAGGLRVRAAWVAPVAVFCFVLVTQLWLVAGAGTDIPFQDQWDVEGRWLYPAWRDGTLHAADLLRPHNEHRIVWTYVLDLALFAANGGQWDPLVQMTAGAVLRAAIAALLARAFARGLGTTGRAWVALAVSVAFLPLLAWHNALWGFQSQVYFSLLFSLLALEWLGATEISRGRCVAGIVAGVAALLAMGAGAFVPVALLGLIVLRAIESRRFAVARWREAWPALVLLALALTLRAEVPEHAMLRAASVGNYFRVLVRVLAWPHVDAPLAALVLNLPVAVVVGARLAGRRRAAVGEDFVLLLAGWAVANAGATAWARGASDEFAAGVPSRYVDFIMLLPLANAWCVVALAREAVGEKILRTRALAAAWGVFLAIGWLGLSMQMLRGVIQPRLRDRDAPVRLAREFQRTGDATVFDGQPRLLVPHPNPESVRAVLTDPRMRGALPPSLQPDQPVGPLSRAVRTLLQRP